MISLLKHLGGLNAVILLVIKIFGNFSVTHVYCAPCLANDKKNIPETFDSISMAL